MIKRYDKSDVNEAMLSAMEAGEQFVVTCDSYTAFNTAQTQVRNVTKRKQDELKNKGIDYLKAEIIKGGCDILVTAVKVASES